MSPETNAVSERPCNAATSTVAAITGSSVRTEYGEVEVKVISSNPEVTMSAPTKKCERSVAAQQPASTSPLLSESLGEPLSPATSSSSASQATVSSSALAAADATFEPTIDMMVNDFDDEQTLNEEEALAEQELQDPHDEIATLREESEMPIEELLAKYQSMPMPETPTAPWRKRIKKKKIPAETQQFKRTDEKVAFNETEVENTRRQHNVEAEDVNGIPEKKDDEDVIVIESGDEEDITDAAGGSKTLVGSSEMEQMATGSKIALSNVSSIMRTTNTSVTSLDKLKSRRSHLLDLYPGEYTTATADSCSVAAGEAVEKEIFSGEDDEEDDDDDEEEGEEEEDEADTDYVKKTIMVGSAYQAVIPDGLSQYGDVLPYENEDKLVWEPSQVSEREVEQFLLNSRDIKPTLSDDLMMTSSTCDETISRAPPPAKAIEMKNASERESPLDCGKATKDSITQLQKQRQGKQSNENKATPVASICESEAEFGAVVKDNEQTLHLLVQCGYDFKEALRRKRLNAVPLTGSMSLWSEEECHKFEEGIQKYGKDFLKIRQNQVRTRTMRELVQFYYLWKKSERRDHDFANADTVDHMDIYLNEGGDYASASTSAAAGACLPVAVNTAPPAYGTRKASAQKNISIMTGGIVASSSSSISSATNASSAVGAAAFASRKRIALSGGLLSNSSINDNQSAGSAATSHSAK